MSFHIGNKPVGAIKEGEMERNIYSLTLFNMMKKLIRFATMALLLAVPLSSRATTDTLVVADGTVSHDHMPIYGFYADAAQHNQIIYPASTWPLCRTPPSAACVRATN